MLNPSRTIYIYSLLIIECRYYLPLVLIIALAVPTLVPYYFWDESLITSFLVAAIARHCWALNMTLMVNSAAHAAFWGEHSYDKSVQ